MAKRELLPVDEDQLPASWEELQKDPQTQLTTKDKFWVYKPVAFVAVMGLLSLVLLILGQATAPITPNEDLGIASILGCIGLSITVLSLVVVILIDPLFPLSVGARQQELNRKRFLPHYALRRMLLDSRYYPQYKVVVQEDLSDSKIHVFIHKHLQGKEDKQELRSFALDEEAEALDYKLDLEAKLHEIREETLLDSRQKLLESAELVGMADRVQAARL